MPVGSVSYHFDSVRAFLVEASERILALRTETLRAWAKAANGETLAHDAATLIHEQTTTGRELTVLAYELFILGLRDSKFRAISDAVAIQLAQALSSHVPHGTAQAVAAAIDGLQMHTLLRSTPYTVQELHHELELILRSTQTPGDDLRVASHQ